MVDPDIRRAVTAGRSSSAVNVRTDGYPYPTRAGSKRGRSSSPIHHRLQAGLGHLTP